MGGNQNYILYIAYIYISCVDSLNWKDPTPQQISERVLSQVKPDSIVLFHNGAKNTPAALPTMLKKLQSEGCEIVPVSELICKNSYTKIPKIMASGPNLFTSSAENTVSGK